MKNRLSLELSPYLQQHKDNPIAWWAWGDEAFNEAKRLDRPIFLSIGYSTCHWCHVMAHECFEDQEVADFINQHFISIKVDREERPDVDAVYMNVLQTLSGGGGWPLSAWMTPDAKPFFAGTYFPKLRFLQILRRITEVWERERRALLQDSARLMDAVRGNQAQSSESSASMQEFLQSYINSFQDHFDEENGGFGRAPKFPQTMNLMTMMRQDFHSGLHQAEALVQTTLLKMARGGMYDHLHGGFHRYSVDEKWLVPHFEKMLYDQAMISVTLSEAYQLYGEPELARTLSETTDYILTEMRSPEGGFYSAQDADSLNPTTGHLDEGYFCTFDANELKANLTQEEFDAVSLAYGITTEGQFEGRNILHLQEGVDGSALLDPRIRSAFQKLKTLRKSKPQPHLDDKIITAWNGLMIWSLIRTSTALAQPRYLEQARQSLEFIHGNLYVGGRLFRYRRNGQSLSAATSEDYAAVILSCIEYSQYDSNPKWSDFALQLQSELDVKFWDDEDGLYYLNDGQDPHLPLRSKEEYDGVTPSSNSMAAYNLWRLYLLTGKSEYKEKSQRITARLFPKLERSPSSLSFLAMAIDLQLSDVKVMIKSGGGWTDEFQQSQSLRFWPDVIWLSDTSNWPVVSGKKATKPAYFVCREGACLPPVESIEDLQKILKPF